MKKSLNFILVVALLLSLCSCGRGDNNSKSAPNPNVSDNTPTTSGQTGNNGSNIGAPSTDNPSTNVPDTSDFGTTGGIKVETDLFDVTITVPANFIDEDTTQAQLDQQAVDQGFQSITLNEDGSATYIMTKNQHNKMMEELKTSIDKSLSDMASSDDYPGITSITANEDYTKFTIAMNTEQIGLETSLSVLALYVFGGMYNAFNGTAAENINVQFINEATGVVIREANSNGG